ncbi:MAG: TVP38/TMEM64 family protein [Peptostreptococcaceae bacterium]|nr:TVP38/TMEM64 family protein [Peptostreptococcaceae bacterium]
MKKKKKINVKAFSYKSRTNRRQGRHIFYDDVRYNVNKTSMHDRLVAFAKLFLLLIISVGVPVLIFVFNKDFLNQFSSAKELVAFVENYKGATYLALMGLQAMQIIISVIPGQPIQFASSYIYGFWNGYLISMAGAVVGTFVTYHLARFLGKDALHILFGEKRVNDIIKKLNSTKSYGIIILIYMIPGIPKDIMCYVAGISEIKIIPFLIISTIGRTPGIMGSLLIGSMLESKNYIGMAVLAVIAIAIFYIFIKNRKKIMEFVDSKTKKE